MPSRTRKFRGSRNHGRGIKAGRGAGKQGGRGNAGLHKYKFKSMLIYAPDHFGRHGFKRPPESIDHPVAVNVGELHLLLPRLQEANAVKQEGGAWVADLGAIGIDRLLGGGKAEGTWKVEVPHASAHAREKVTVLTAEAPKAPPKGAGGAPPKGGGGAPPKGGGGAPPAAAKAAPPPKPKAAPPAAAKPPLPTKAA
jgi:large subunit ribosomal protein L15